MGRSDPARAAAVARSRGTQDPKTGGEIQIPLLRTAAQLSPNFLFIVRYGMPCGTRNVHETLSTHL